LIHAIRRNVDVTYIIIDNHIYGLTKGQTSPTSPTGFTSKSTPKGSLDTAVSPIQLALSAGIGFLGQAFVGNPKQMIKLIESGIKYNGFSLIIALSNCITYNKVNTLKWFRENIHDLDNDETYSPSDRKQALLSAVEHNDLVTGLIYHEEKASCQDLLPGYPNRPLVAQNLTPQQEILDNLTAAFY